MHIHIHFLRRRGMSIFDTPIDPQSKRFRPPKCIEKGCSLAHLRRADK